jgi:GGDEF domain-containing protein
MWLPWKRAAQPDNTSLQSLMRRLSDLENLIKDSAGGYRAALGSLERHVPPLAGPVRDRFRKELRSLTKTIGTAVQSRHWDELSKNFDASVKQYCRDLEGAVRSHEDEAKQVMAMMAVLAESMAARERTYSVRFRDIAKKTRMLVTTQDIAVIRQRLSEEMTQLEKYVDDLERDTAQAVERLNYDVRQTRERHDSTWDGLPEDPITELPGKAMGAGVLEAFLRLKTRFGAGLFTIQAFAEIERQHGSKASIEILQQFVSRLKSSFREPDFICRWGRSQFLLISEDNLAQLTTRASNVARLLTGSYRVSAGASVELACDFNIVERIGDRDASELLARLEAA